MVNVIKRIVPSFVKRMIEREISKSTAPRMIYGYTDPDGKFRPNTRTSNTVFFNHPEKVFIEDNVFVWHYSILDGTGGLRIGEGCHIGAWVGLFTHSSHVSIRLMGRHYRGTPQEELKGFVSKPVEIGKYTFIGSGVMVMPGVTIGKGVFVTPGSVVKNRFNDFDIVSGNPAKVIGDTRKLDKYYLKDPLILEWYNEWQ